MKRHFLLSEILIEKEEKGQIDKKKLEEYNWNFDVGNNLQKIYKDMLKEYFLPISSWERFRMLKGKSHSEEFWRVQLLAKEEFTNFCSNAVSGMMCTCHRRNKEAGQAEYFKCSESFLSTLKMNQKDKEKRPDNIYEGILRDVIFHRASYFYLDICQSIYYSIMYYTDEICENQFVTLLNEKEQKDDIANITSGWEKFNRKAIDRMYRLKKQKVLNEKEKLPKEGIFDLSNFRVEIPFDTKCKYKGKEIFIEKFGADIIRFFIRNEDKDTEGRRQEDIIDLFSKKKKERYTIEHYESYVIKDLLKTFVQYDKNYDIINQFLLEQSFAVDICDNICDFIEIVFPADKLTKNNIKQDVVKYIDLFVAEIRKCVPMFSKLLILEVTKNLLSESKDIDRDMRDYIRQGCERLELASKVVGVLNEEMNYLYYNFCNQFYYAIDKKYDGDLEKIKNDLMSEIIQTKKKLHIKRYTNYEYMDVRVFKDVERKKHDELYPYVQKAMMTEYTL